MSNFFVSDLASANSKSRLRMITLYHIATTMQGIVVGTGNKVEDFGVGFYTKYGDGGVDISPIADLYKTEVRELGRHLGVPQEIINATPTDGLWDDDRNDEQQIGASYEELEWVMEYGQNKSDYTKKELQLVNTYKHLNEKNKHKMVSIPTFNLIENKII
jgi:NAD+ synthase